MTLAIKEAEARLADPKQPADDRLAHAPGARLVLAMPARAVLPVTEALAAALLEPAEIVAGELP